MPSAMKRCFVIRPIGEDGSDVRRHSTERYEHFIKPICESCGYTHVSFAADGPSNGMITHDVITQIIESDLVIADLTGHNPNAFYELSLRHALRKPYVCIADRRDSPPLPFDTRDCRAVLIDSKEKDFLLSDSLKKELETNIKEAERAGSDIQSPIAMSVDLMRLGRGGDLERATRAAVLNSEHIIKILGGIVEPIRFKIYEIFENFCVSFELSCLKGFTNYVNLSPELDREYIVRKIHAAQHYVRSAVQNIQSELQSVVVKYLRSTQQ